MKYIKVIQKPYCCVGACIEMILNRNNIIHNGQVDIACKLGLTVPKEYKTIYPNAIFGSKPTSGYGTQIQKEEYSINNFSRKISQSGKSTWKGEWGRLLFNKKSLKHFVRAFDKIYKVLYY